MTATNNMGLAERFRCRVWACVLLLAMLLLSLAVAQPAEARRGSSSEDGDDALLRYRARIVTLSPTQPAMIHYRYGGEGLGGDVRTGVVTREKPAPPPALGDDDTGIDLQAMLDGPPKDRIIVPGDTWNVHYLNPGVWSRSRPLRELRSSRLTFMATGHESGQAVRDCVLEFEVSYDGKVVKTFSVNGPDGPTFGVIIPFRALGPNDQPTPEFLKGLGSLMNHIQIKQELLKQEPWFSWPLPKLTGVISDCSGYGVGAGYGKRTSDKATMLAEVQVLHMMGMNGFRGSEAFVTEMTANREGVAAHFTRAKLGRAGGGFPIPTISRGDGRAPFRSRNDGCPYHPGNMANIPKIVANSVSGFVEAARASGVQDYWGLTIDEIGNVFGGSNEGGNHPGSCPHCSEAFRDMIRDDGLSYEDFGARDWSEIRPVSGYWAINYWDSHAILSQKVAEAKKTMEDATKQKPIGLKEDMSDFSLEEKEPVDHAANLVAARARLKALEWSSRILFVPEEERQVNMHEEGWHLLQYYNRQFMARTSAVMFHPMREAVKAENKRKQDAIDRGDLDAPEATQPWLYAFGLRQPRFTWGGGSLGMFDYYRYADTAMVYETSNRDPRIYQWDSYMNDVGRSLQRFCGVEFGVYVKPHRGAPVQRALSAATRGSKLLYWYTYGPEWKKGDSFGGSPHIRAKVAYANRLVAATEDVLVGGEWALPAEVAIVRPRTAEYFSGNASWENGKWNYMALAHAHVPMDPIDEVFIEQNDLSPYKVIVVSGSHLRRKSAEKLKQWVADGGTLYTNGYGMAKDEAGRHLETLHEVFGVTSRIDEMPTWGSVRRYGATGLPGIRPDGEPATDSQVTATSLIEGSHQPMVGLETLTPTASAEVLATNAAGKPVAVRNRYGKGQAYLIGTYAGMEYAHETMRREPYSDAKRSWIAAPVLNAGIEPIVKVSDPLVEGTLIQNDKSGKQAVTLLNWYGERSVPTLENVTVTFRGFGDRRTVRSTALQRELPATVDGEWMTVTLPELGDGDVLVIE